MKPRMDKAFHVLHAVYHEQDFRVRVNDPTVNFVCRSLAECVELPVEAPKYEVACPACRAGYSFLIEQPIAADR